jgi:site-specific DNA-cytosine methylase
MSVVWALFDSETATVAKALPEHEVYSFGIGSCTEHIHLDLSNFETAVKELEKYPKPDVIFASPPTTGLSAYGRRRLIAN